MAYLRLSKAETNKLEKRLNRFLGGHYFPIKEIDDDQDGNIDRVVVDFERMKSSQEVDNTNTPTGNYLIDLRVLKYHLNNIGKPLQDKIEGRGTKAIKTFITDNKVIKKDAKFIKFD